MVRHTKRGETAMGFELKKYTAPDFTKEPFVSAPDAVLALSLIHISLAQAGIDMEKEDPFRVGVSVGSGIGSLGAMEREHKKMLEKGPGRINPLLVPIDVYKRQGD